MKAENILALDWKGAGPGASDPYCVATLYPSSPQRDSRIGISAQGFAYVTCAEPEEVRDQAFVTERRNY